MFRSVAFPQGFAHLLWNRDFPGGLLVWQDAEKLFQQGSIRRAHVVAGFCPRLFSVG
jgi:hypothetical protein